MAMWVNPNLLKANKKVGKWKPSPEKEKVLWGLCSCGEILYEGESVGMYGEHAKVICYACWMSGKFPEFHVDCAGLHFPDATLAQ